VKTIKQFLTSVYSATAMRRDSYLELGMALAASEQVESVVALSESPLYRRSFSSVYETLKAVEIDEAALLKANLTVLRERCQLLGGYEVYSGDSTFITRGEAQTLEARTMKRLASGALVYGHESYWSMRLSDKETSWSGVALVERMQGETVTSTAAKHLKLIDKASPGEKLFVMDAGHGKAVLRAYQHCRNTDIVIRLKSGQVFYHAPRPYQGRGRPAKHGKPFKLSAEASSPDDQKLVDYKSKALRISLWRGLHYASYSEVEGVILKLEFLDKDKQPLFKNPIWLFSTATTAEGDTLALAYLWRSSHELTFRFLKQHLGLTKSQSPDINCCDTWYQLVAIAMNLLLALKDQLQSESPPWYPQAARRPLSQRRVQKQALGFLLKLATPTKAPRPAGKAPGRATGYRPLPRIRHPVIRKTPRRTKACPTCPFKATA
jgi:hypothetical protein